MVRWLCEKTSQVALVVLGILMLLTTADVALRYLLNRPIAGAFELVEFMIVIVAFLTMAHTQTEKGHISVEFVMARLPQRFQIVINRIISFLSLGLLSLITWRTVVLAQSTRVALERSPLLHLPVYIFMLVAAFGCVLFCLALLVDVVGREAPMDDK